MSQVQAVVQDNENPVKKPLEIKNGELVEGNFDPYKTYFGKYEYSFTFNGIPWGIIKNAISDMKSIIPERYHNSVYWTFDDGKTDTDWQSFAFIKWEYIPNFLKNKIP